MIRDDRLSDAAVSDRRARTRVHLCLSVASLCLTCGSMALAGDAPGVITPPAATRDIFSRFAGVLEVLQKHFVDPSRLQDAGHATAALREFVRSLDPDADLLTPEEVAAADAAPPDNVGYFGVSLTISNDYPVVISARDGGTAQKARLFTGDQIISIDDQPTKHRRIFEVNHRLRGAVGSVVRLGVLDVTGNERSILIARAAPRPQPMARVKFIGNGIAYYRLSEFTVATVEKLRSELKRVRAEHPRALIIDVRNNAGGMFDAAVIAAKLFLRDKETVVLLESGRPEFRTTFVSDAAPTVAVPLVLLVNSGTAGEAEIFAAALRDNQRARLVGSRTFGRGCQFSQFPLPDGAALSIPTALFLPPSGTSFQTIGLTPDVVVELPRETERALAGDGFGSFDWVNDKAKVLKDDLVLARALQEASRPASK